ncbi:MAG: AI-2E family transporter, partial [Syntrophothermus sp.]
MDKETSRFPKSTSFFIDIMGIVVIFIILKELREIFIPLVIAYFLFFLFMPVNNYLKKYRFPDALIILVDLLLIIFVFGGFSSVMIDSFSRLGAALPGYEQRLNYIVSSTARDWKVKNPALLNFRISDVLQGMDYSLLAGNIFSSTFSFLGNLFFVIFFFIFVYTGHQDMYEAISKWFLKRNIQPAGQSPEEHKTGMEPTAETAGTRSKQADHPKEEHHTGLHFFRHSGKKDREI